MPELYLRADYTYDLSAVRRETPSDIPVDSFSGVTNAILCATYFMSETALALVIFGTSYLAIITERIHKTIVALCGGALMIGACVLAVREVFHSHEFDIGYNVILFLLIACWSQPTSLSLTWPGATGIAFHFGVSSTWAFL